MDDDGLLYHEEAAVTNHQLQRLPSSLMNSLQSKKNAELFQMHDIKELDAQHYLNQCQGNVFKQILPFFASEIKKQYHFLLTLH